MSRHRFGLLFSLLFRSQKSSTPVLATHTFNTAGMDKNKFLIVGLGNYDFPGTRHNVGMMFVDWLAHQLQIKWTNDNKHCKGYVTSYWTQDEIELVLLKPKLAMNICGRSVSKTVQYYHVPVENVFLVHDDLSKSLGKVSVKLGGSAGGHNGVKSVISALQSDAFKRIKIGIDRPESKDPNIVANYVLSKFRTEERQELNDVIPKAVKYLEKHISGTSGAQVELISRVT